MRACKFSRTHVPGRKKSLPWNTSPSVHTQKEEINPGHSDFHQFIKYVTICFANQKNGHKMEQGTQGMTGHDTFFPVKAWSQAYQHVLRHFLKPGNHTTICLLHNHRSGKWVEISSTGLAKLFQKICPLCWARNQFGFKPEDLGSQSIRSRAAMLLFMMNHSTKRIDIPG